MRRFFSVELGEVEGDLIVLEQTASHHLLRVTGIGRGELVGLFDGRGRGCRARLIDVRAGQAVLERQGSLSEEGAGGESWLVVGLSRARVFDLVIRMATELGVAHIWPIQADRTVVRGERIERWQRVSRAALGQSGGLAPPEIAAPMRLQEALERLPAEVERRLFVPGVPRRAPMLGPVALLIGPEGGWSPAEHTLAQASGSVPTGLGPRTLRVETAVAAALGSLRPAGAETS